MTRVLRSELLKLRTIRMPWYVLATAAGLTVAEVAFKASRAGAGRRMAIPPLNTVAGLTRVITSSDFALLLAVVLGVIIASGEFHHRTATATYLAQPHRTRVLVAKLATASSFGLLFGAVAAALATGIGLAFVAAKGYPVTVPTGTIVQYFAGAALASALLAAIGVGIGSLVRSQVTAVVGVLVWGFVIERIIGALYSSVATYLPFTAATTLAGQPLDAALIRAGATALSFGAAALLVAGIAAALSLVASQTTVGADIA